MTSTRRPTHHHAPRGILGLAVITMILILPKVAQAQRLAVGDSDESYFRVLQISGRASLRNSFLIRPLSVKGAVESVADTTEHPWKDRWMVSFREHVAGESRVFGHDPISRLVVNSGYPEGGNDGALTPGRGLTAALDLGGTIRLGRLTVSIRPLLAFTQNTEFPLAEVEVAGQPEYAYPWRLMDLPQRFGPDPYWTLDPGQSEIRLDVAGVSTSFGTTNLWWGPGTRNAILMSNNAAGIPHVSFATRRPIGVGIGVVEAQWIFGHLQQSDWFDPTIEDQGRYIVGATAAFSPNFWGLDGLSLGMARVSVAKIGDGVEFGDFFSVFQNPQKKSFGEDSRDGIFSLFGRWVLPRSGFEVYGEWARNDHGTDVRDYFLNLEHAQAYVLGLQKATTLRDGRIVTFTAELTHLQNTADSNVRAGIGRVRGGIGGAYYAHDLVRRGYTQKGEVIGAQVGPGGNSMFLGVDVYAPWGKASGFVQRSVRDKDAFLVRAEGNPDFGQGRIDGSLGVGGAVTVFRGNWDVQGEASLTDNLNRYFRYRSDHVNLRVGISMRWRSGWSGVQH